LAGIRSTVQLWQCLPETALRRESLDAVVSAVDRLNALVSRLLLFSRADSADRELVDLNRVFGEGLDLVAAQAAQQGVVPERDFAAGLPAVTGSANALRQVALNLLSNALQAMPAGGRLRCATRSEGNVVEVRVNDSGQGITEEARPRLFEPFFTTRPDGTGLGLALCREVIEGHGGRIELEATGPAGTTFRISLPAGAKP
jgi:two-component system, NtrC family, sensor histidine kinase HydH